MRVVDLGLIGFRDALKVQLEWVRRVQLDPDSEVLILAEHHPVYTIGRRGSVQNILDMESAVREGIEVVRVDRGGDVFYHGPGQMVGYPIISLVHHGLSVGEYVRLLEEAIIRTLSRFGVAGVRRPGYPGVWVGNSKIGAIGLRISGGVSMHGVAINVDPNMDHFRYIVACGIRGAGVTSIRAVTGRAVDMGKVKRVFSGVLAELLGVELE